MSKKTVVPAETAHIVAVVPADIAEEYQEQADSAGTTLATVVSERLTKCVYHAADKPLYFDDADRQELDRLLDYNFKSAQEVIERLNSLLSVVKLDALEDSAVIQLSPNQLYRLQGRCNYGAKLGDKAKEFALEGINREIGIY